MNDLDRKPAVRVPSNEFRLDRANGKIWGVCGGIANFAGIDPMIVRIAFRALARNKTRAALTMLIFQRLNRERGITLVLVTHEPDIAAYADRIVVFKDGRIQKDYAVTASRDAAEELKNLPAVGDEVEEEV